MAPMTRPPVALEVGSTTVSVVAASTAASSEPPVPALGWPTAPALGCKGGSPTAGCRGRPPVLGGWVPAAVPRSCSHEEGRRARWRRAGRALSRAGRRGPGATRSLAACARPRMAVGGAGQGQCSGGRQLRPRRLESREVTEVSWGRWRGGGWPAMAPAAAAQGGSLASGGARRAWRLGGGGRERRLA